MGPSSHTNGGGRSEGGRTRAAIVAGFFTILAAAIGAAATIWAGNGGAKPSALPPPSTNAPHSSQGQTPAAPQQSAAPEELPTPTEPEWAGKRWQFRKVSVSLAPGTHYEIDRRDEGSTPAANDADFEFDHGASDGTGKLTFENGAYLIGGIKPTQKPEIQDCVDNAGGEHLPFLGNAGVDSWWCMSTSDGNIIAFRVTSIDPMNLDVYDMPPPD